MALASFLFGVFFIMMFAACHRRLAGPGRDPSHCDGKTRHYGLPDQRLRRIASTAAGHPDVRPGRGHFDRAGVAERLLRFTEAIIGRGGGRWR